MQATAGTSLRVLYYSRHRSSLIKTMDTKNMKLPVSDSKAADGVVVLEAASAFPVSPLSTDVDRGRFIIHLQAAERYTNMQLRSAETLASNRSYSEEADIK